LVQALYLPGLDQPLDRTLAARWAAPLMQALYLPGLDQPLDPRI